MDSGKGEKEKPQRWLGAVASGLSSGVKAVKSLATVPTHTHTGATAAAAAGPAGSTPAASPSSDAASPARAAAQASKAAAAGRGRGGRGGAPTPARTHTQTHTPLTVGAALGARTGSGKPAATAGPADAAARQAATSLSLADIDLRGSYETGATITACISGRALMPRDPGMATSLSPLLVAWYRVINGAQFVLVVPPEIDPPVVSYVPVVDDVGSRILCRVKRIRSDGTAESMDDTAFTETSTVKLNDSLSKAAEGWKEVLQRPRACTCLVSALFRSSEEVGTQEPSPYDEIPTTAFEVEAARSVFGTWLGRNRPAYSGPSVTNIVLSEDGSHFVVSTVGADADVDLTVPIAELNTRVPSDPRLPDGAMLVTFAVPAKDVLDSSVFGTMGAVPSAVSRADDAAGAVSGSTLPAQTHAPAASGPVPALDSGALPDAANHPSATAAAEGTAADTSASANANEESVPSTEPIKPSASADTAEPAHMLSAAATSTTPPDDGDAGAQRSQRAGTEANVVNGAGTDAAEGSPTTVESGPVKGASSSDNAMSMPTAATTASHDQSHAPECAQHPARAAACTETPTSKCIVACILRFYTTKERDLFAVCARAARGADAAGRDLTPLAPVLDSFDAPELKDAEDKYVAAAAIKAAAAAAASAAADDASRASKLPLSVSSWLSEASAAAATATSGIVASAKARVGGLVSAAAAQATQATASVGDGAAPSPAPASEPAENTSTAIPPSPVLAAQTPAVDTAAATAPSVAHALSTPTATPRGHRASSTASSLALPHPAGDETAAGHEEQVAGHEEQCAPLTATQDQAAVEELATLQRRLDASMLECAQLKQRLDETTRHTAAITDALQSKDKMLCDMTEQMARLKQQVEDAQQSATNAMVDYKRITSVLSAQSGDLTQLRTKVASLTEQLDVARAGAAAAKAECTDAEGRIDKLQKQFQQTSALLQAAQGERDALRHESTSLREQLEAARDEISSKARASAKLTAAYEDVRARYEAQTTELKRVKSEQADKDTHLQQVTDELEALKKTSARLQTQFTLKEAEATAAATERDDLRAALATATSKLAAHGSSEKVSREAMDAANARADALAIEVAALQAKVTQLGKVLETTSSEKLDAQRREAALSNECADLRGRVATLESKVKKFTSTAESTESLREQIAGLREQLDATVAERNAAQRKADSLRRDVLRMTGGSEELKSIDIETLSKAKRSLEEKVMRLTAENARLTEDLETAVSRTLGSAAAASVRVAAAAASPASNSPVLAVAAAVGPIIQGTTSDAVRARELQRLANTLAEQLADKDEALAQQRSTKEMLAARIRELEARLATSGGSM